LELDLSLAENLLDKKRLANLRNIFSREGLDQSRRAASAIAYLQALGDSENLVTYLRLFIQKESDLTAAYEVLLQGYLFCGYPRAIESFFCLQEALGDRDDLDPGDREPVELLASERLLERGGETHKTVHGRNFEKMRNKISALSPDLAYLMIAEGYGHILCRPDLDLRTRELAVVASISAVGSYRQLNSHIRGCRNVGCEDVEIYESIITGLLWMPAERISESLGIWSEITSRPIPETIADISI